MKTIHAFILFLFCGLLTAQSSVKDFKLGAYAQILDEECIRLTPDIPYASGSAWFKNPIDLNQPFELLVCLVLGEKDDQGADGIGFVFHPAMRTGYRGEGMGFSGLYPSLGIEFDTYQNFHLGDPVADHIAIMPNGVPYHAVKPTEVDNLEDGKKHLFQLLWDPYDKVLTIDLDGDRIVTYSADVVNDIFGGNGRVFWGVTAATGRLSNYQDICIKKLVYAGVE